MKKIILSLFLVLCLVTYSFAGTTVTLKDTETEPTSGQVIYNGVFESCALSSTKIAIAYRGKSNYLDTRVISISNGVFGTIGAATENIAGDIQPQVISMCRLTDTSYVIYYYSGSYSYAKICTVSGTTVTAGSQSAAMSAGYGLDIYQMRVARLSDTSFVAVHDRQNANGNYLEAVACTISGTNVTVGTIKTDINGTIASAYPIVVPLTSTSFIIASQGIDGYLDAVYCTVSGTTISSNTYKRNLSGSKVVGSLDGCRLSDTSFALVFKQTTSYPNNAQGLVCTVSGTTINGGTLHTNLSDSTTVCTFSINVAPVDSTTFSFSYALSDATGYLYARICTYNTGTTVITAGSRATLIESQMYGWGRLSTASTGMFIASDCWSSAGNYYGRIASFSNLAPPSAPGNPTFSNVANKSMTVSWSAATGATSYTLQRGGSNISTNATSPYNDSGLFVATSYTYRVIAVNADGSTNCAADQSQTTTYWSKKMNGSTVKKINGNYVDKVNGN